MKIPKGILYAAKSHIDEARACVGRDKANPELVAALRDTARNLLALAQELEDRLAKDKANRAAR